ncbi:DUF998 domain-containing protein [Chloroflexota bacterium]
MIKEVSSRKGAILRRIAGVCGITSQLVAFTALLVAISASPRFRWTENDISVLGVEGSATALFNWGLILTGLLSLIFAIGLGQGFLSSRLGQLGMASLILGSISMSAIGIFPRTIDLPHDVASIAFFVFIIIALLLVGVAAITASQMRWGLLSLMAGVLMLAFWLVPWPWSGGAIPQLLCCLPWSLWTIVFGVGLLVRASPVDI